MAISVPTRRRWWQRAADDEVGPAEAAVPRATVEAPAALGAVVAASCLGAAVVHFAFAPGHFDESRVHGAFFFFAGWVQLGLGIAVLLRPARPVLRAVVVVNAAMVLVWVLSRTVGVPFGDGAWTAESVGWPDAVATGLEIVAIVGAYALLAGWVAARAVSRVLAVAGGAVLALGLVALTTASVTPALAGDHGDGHGDGQSHAAGDAGAHASGGADGHGTGHAEAGAVAAGGIETTGGQSPCERSGPAVEATGEGAGGHGNHGPSVQQAITDPAVREQLGNELATARAAAMSFPTAAAAEAAGYRKVTNYIPCIAAHYMKFSLVDGTFDAGAPEMLLFDGNGPEARIVGLSYYVSGSTTTPEGFAGPNDPWHQHVGLCVRGALVVGGSRLTEDQCAARGGVKSDGSTSWMVHAWVVPGWESAWGTFSAEHPELGKLAA
jgi:hypothetical protein